MVSLAEYKKALGKTADLLTEEQIESAYYQSQKIAKTLFDMWVKSTKRNKQIISIMMPEFDKVES